MLFCRRCPLKHTRGVTVDLLQKEPTLDAFFAHAAAAPERALLLDYDGTLAPFHSERDQAFPYPGVRELLGALIAAGRTRLVIISGRGVSDLIGVLGIEPLPELWGSHGWERRLPDGRLVMAPIGNEASEGMAAAALAAVECGLEQALEQKPVGLALHWRGLAPRTVQALREEIGQAWSAIVLRYGLRVEPFDGGLELRVPGHSKGTAARTLLDELAPDTALAYLGDDLTDEDAFHVIGSRGLRILARPERRPSAADLWLRPPEELLSFLKRWTTLDTIPTSIAKGSIP
jgi:trehalose 6-phosphate phosphatase